MIAEHGWRRIWTSPRVDHRAGGIGDPAGDQPVDELFASLPPAQRDLILDNGEVLFPIELPAFAAFVPDRERMRAGGVPLTVAVGAENATPGWGPRRRGWRTAPAPSSSSCPAGTSGS